MTIEMANRLYELRKKKNLSQEELAEKLGVSRQAVSKWERSEASPDTDNLIALAKIYGLTLDELVYGKKENSDEDKKDERGTNSSEESDSSENEGAFIDVNDGENKVKIDRTGILVESEDGETIKIKLSSRIMDRVIKKIEDEMDESDLDDDDDEDDDDWGVEEPLVKSISIDSDGHLKINTEKKKKKARFWLEVPYAVICAVLYLIFGFYNICGGWALSWVIFVTIPVYYTLVESIYDRKFSGFAYPVLCAFVYLIFGLYYKNWHPSWIVFVTIPVYYPIAKALDRLIVRK